jgi:hypothetical protein
MPFHLQWLFIFLFSTIPTAGYYAAAIGLSLVVKNLPPLFQPTVTARPQFKGMKGRKGLLETEAYLKGLSSVSNKPLQPTKLCGFNAKISRFQDHVK